MPRDLHAGESLRRARARRESAMARQELGQPTSPRDPAAGPTSMAVKRRDTTDDRLVAEFLAQRGGQK